MTELPGTEGYHKALRAEMQERLRRCAEEGVVDMLNDLASICEDWFSHQGFGDSSKSEMIALEHSELSERLEAVRHNDTENEHEEAADAFTRLLHYCGKYRVHLGARFLEKMLENLERPYKHGKGF